MSIPSSPVRMWSRMLCSQKQEPPSAVEDPRAQFWEHYQREVEKEGREFAEKHDEGLRTWLRTVRSRKQESLSADEDRRAQFYKHYQREAKEYDSEFTKKHNEDLNTTLIFVRFSHSSPPHVLTRVIGWPVFRRDFRVHHPGPPPAPARPE